MCGSVSFTQPLPFLCYTVSSRPITSQPIYSVFSALCLLMRSVETNGSSRLFCFLRLVYELKGFQRLLCKVNYYFTGTFFCKQGFRFIWWEVTARQFIPCVSPSMPTKKLWGLIHTTVSKLHRSYDERCMSPWIPINPSPEMYLRVGAWARLICGFYGYQHGADRREAYGQIETLSVFCADLWNDAFLYLASGQWLVSPKA